MNKLDTNEKQAKKIIPVINNLIDEINLIKKDIKLIKEVLLDNFDKTGYLEDHDLQRKINKKMLDN